MTELILALDIGSKRIGMALGSHSTGLATPHTAIPRKDAENMVIALLIERDISTLVVGMPFNEDGSRNEACARVEQFCRRVVRRLQARGSNNKGPKFQIIIVDEYASSATAREQLQAVNAGLRRGKRLLMRKQGIVDCAAAAMILQAYLDNSGAWPVFKVD